MFKTLTLICALMLSVTFSVSARAADDDVFLDEGNGDFDQMPISQPVAEEPAAPAQAPTEPMPMLTEEAGQLPGMEEAPVQEPAKPVKKAKKEKVAKAVEAPVEQPVAETEAPAPKAKKTAKKSSGAGAGAGGKFVTTKDACPMMRSPASTAETMLTVKPARKIWVEKAGAGWVKGWNKAGEEGFISTDCVE